eukprot:UN11538
MINTDFLKNIKTFFCSQIYCIRWRSNQRLVVFFKKSIREDGVEMIYDSEYQVMIIMNFNK